MNNGVTKVLIVDDSAYVRKVFSEMISRSPFLEVVGAARDGREALELVEQLQPDVVTCDLNMPEMNGVAFVEAQMARRPVPIIIISVANRSADDVLAALDAGAIDFVQKPTALASERLMEVAEELRDKLKAAAAIPVTRLAPAPQPSSPVAAALPRSAVATVDVVVIGTSTGGPQALKAVISRLPRDMPVPVAIVLHMPVGYTAAYAMKLDELCAVTVVEAIEGMELRPGTAILATAGRHLTFRRVLDRVVVHLDLRPLDAPHRPSVDVLFHSAAEVFGSRVLAIVMTGMGADGRDGAASIKKQGGCIVTEAEESCVVYGMPRAIVEAGLSDAAAPLARMAEAIMERI